MENGENLGFARAVNKGYKKTSGKYLLILNPDIQILPGSIDKMIHFLEESSGDRAPIAQIGKS